MKKQTQRLAQQLFGAIAFYTTIPISPRWTLDFSRIARFSPLVGLIIGLLLFIFAQILSLVFPPLPCAVLLIAIWLKLTGALHLDGVMDTADGLGVFDPEKRLIVMADSRSGAFGVIAGITLLLMKVTAISEILGTHSLFLCLVPIWGRFAHIVAVGQYPYLKAEGKGAIHHDNFVPFWDYLPGLMTLLFLSAVLFCLTPYQKQLLCLSLVTAPLTSWGVGRWYFQKFQGMTGDVHGAIVEWTETLILMEIVALSQVFHTI